MQTGRLQFQAKVGEEPALTRWLDKEHSQSEKEVNKKWAKSQMHSGELLAVPLCQLAHLPSIITMEFFILKSTLCRLSYARYCCSPALSIGQFVSRY